MSSERQRYSYARVSLDRLNPENQQRVIDAYIDTQGVKYNKLTEYVSGRKMSGEKFVDLWQRVKENKVAEIVFYAIDRCGRNLQQGIAFVQDCNDNNVKVVFLREGCDVSTPSGRMAFNMLMSAAQYEREIIVTRTKTAMEEVKKRPNYNQHLRRRSTTAKIRKKVPDILKLHDAGYSNRAIKKMLGGDERTIAKVIKDRDNLPPARPCTWDKHK